MTTECLYFSVHKMLHYVHNLKGNTAEAMQTVQL